MHCMVTHATATTEPPPPASEAAVLDPVQIIFRLPKNEHAAFKSKCALHSITMQAFIKSKIAEFMEGE